MRAYLGAAVAAIAVLALLIAGPTMCTWFVPAPIGRTITGVKRRLDRDLPKGTSADSAVAYLNRTGVRYVIVRKPTEILGWENAVLVAPFLEEGDLEFRIFFDSTDHIRGDSVYEQLIGM